MREFEIYFSDLNERAQKYYLEFKNEDADDGGVIATARIDRSFMIHVSEEIEGLTTNEDGYVIEGDEIIQFYYEEEAENYLEDILSFSVVELDKMIQDGKIIIEEEI